MRSFVIFIPILLFAGCKCDSICEANKTTNKFLASKPPNEQIIDYLNGYKGEAPGSAIYGAFVNWGLEHPEKFINVLNHPKITQQNLEIVVYKIADYGNHAEWCKVYEKLDSRENDKFIRKRLLGCNYGT